MDAGEGVTRHVMVGFSDPADGKQAEAAAVSEATATAGRAAATATGPSEDLHGARLALDARDGVTPMQHEIVLFLIALSIMLPAAFGIMLVNHNVLIQPDGFGVGMSVFALIGTLMLFLRQ
jgi:hypothetical protein